MKKEPSGRPRCHQQWTTTRTQTPSLNTWTEEFFFRPCLEGHETKVWYCFDITIAKGSRVSTAQFEDLSRRKARAARNRGKGKKEDLTEDPTTFSSCWSKARTHWSVVYGGWRCRPRLQLAKAATPKFGSVWFPVPYRVFLHPFCLSFTFRGSECGDIRWRRGCGTVYWNKNKNDEQVKIQTHWVWYLCQKSVPVLTRHFNRASESGTDPWYRFIYTMMHSIWHFTYFLVWTKLGLFALSFFGNFFIYFTFSFISYIKVYLHKNYFKCFSK